MNKRNIIIVAVCAVLAAIAVVLTVVFMPDAKEGKEDTATVGNEEAEVTTVGGDTDDSNESDTKGDVNPPESDEPSEDNTADSTDGNDSGNKKEPPKDEDKNESDGDKEQNNDKENNDSEDTDMEKPNSPEPMKYADYIKLTPAEQQEYFLSFENIDDYFEWYNAAKAEYEKDNPPIDVGDGNIDIGDIINGSN